MRSPLPMHVDAVDLEVVKASLSGIVQEMQNSLFRTGYSTIVRESQDASCALMNASGEVVAQHVVLPLHIGAFPACCGAVIKEFGEEIAPGDAFLINHPYQGGSPHAPDMAVLSPVFCAGELMGKYGRDKILACWDRLFALSEARLRRSFAEWKDGRFEAERFVDDDGIDLNTPVRIPVVAEKG